MICFCSDFLSRFNKYFFTRSVSNILHFLYFTGCRNVLFYRNVAWNSFIFRNHRFFWGMCFSVHGSLLDFFFLFLLIEFQFICCYFIQVLGLFDFELKYCDSFLVSFDYFRLLDVCCFVVQFHFCLSFHIFLTPWNVCFDA